MSSALEVKILEKLKEGFSSAKEISLALSLDFSTISSLIEKLSSQGIIKIEQKKFSSKWCYTKKGKQTYLSGLPESNLLKRFGSTQTLNINDLSQDEKNFGLIQGIKNGWFKLSDQSIILLEKGKEVLEKKSWPTLVEEEKLSGCTLSFLESLKKRGLVEQKQVIDDYIVSLIKDYQPLKQEEKPTISQLSREILLSGSWKNAYLSPYNLEVEVSGQTLAKFHPIQALRRKIKQIFLSMGFKEMSGPIVESSFWNFDALFQPQDHPARDLADTFYINKQSRAEVDSSLIKKIKKIHEQKWGGVWSEELACSTVLRTHTTSISARTLFKKKNKLPEKFFAIGKVFRNEATDYKHLAEFYQVEGIVVWKNANFSHLLGILKEFYLKLGFEKIRFRPSYFPYTEPSLEIEVFDSSRSQWLELGGAGIFRPEVSLPLCGIYPVLAWGLSLERPLMLSFDIKDIRLFYKNEIDWLREFKYIK
ncbi:MAG: phenylalanine--tRNA ligase subunit alpha [Candidatus Micrarchaeota archaeon]|nr:phenylalanine--tRNA ligase subunit alpha [Candidatus Micrarchaeota archaeon]